MPATAANEQEKRFLEDIERHGWHAMLVVGDDEGPSFAYSTGIFERTGRPEIIVFGLQTEVGNFVVNEYARRAIAGEPIETGRRYDGFLDAFPFAFVDVADVALREKHTTWTAWYYQRRAYPLVQGVWPERETGLFPWEPGFPNEYRQLQPVLGPAPGWTQ
ncbi:MAG: DUF4262 domain-containing protein [Hyphomicrobiales bacterium]|nr:DUF4262 domain-containing protein [Hyphomicrobiales bacterium]